MPLRHLSHLDRPQLNSQDPNCVDKNEKYCPIYAEKGFCNNVWVSTNCEKSCGKCGGDPEDPNCYDKSGTEKCQNYVKKGLCDPKINSQVPFSSCVKSCGNCDTSGGKCQDTKSAEYCKSKTSGCHWPSMFWDCRKTCNRCNDKPSCFFDKSGEHQDKDIGNLG